ncbi:LysR family transcriptional regulator [Alteromonas confluentis]|uniref:LysR family transcriptional regulator n=1 Tax=Alteromonas confluentis TaxID=1656094 RepID=A0A1E7Z7G7_9ALTE|nr:LysR family transcriptional regulator [Alteromonas confluentis]OFC69381.1 LysR family transcriptional regulator [Alteromonas confluentis]
MLPVRPISRLSRQELADLNAFCMVERMRSFTKAGVELGITTSALSHAIRNLESRLGIRLLNRTSRTVAPTDAGEALAKQLNKGFSEISAGLETLNQYRDKPAGRIRLNVLSDGARLVLAPHLARFLSAYPNVEVDIMVDDQIADIVEAGFDAGFRYGGTIPEDFVAMKVCDNLRWIAVASPDYLKDKPPIEHPDDLLELNCIQIRTGQGVIMKWDFDRGDERLSIDVRGQVCVGETALGIELALADVGIFYCPEQRVEGYLSSGKLHCVLPNWVSLDDGMYIYYPSFRTPPRGLRELISVLREGMLS